MRPEDLRTCIEEAFGGLDRPLTEEMAAPGLYHEQSYLDSIGAKTWQELRPLRHYIGDGSDIVFLSAKAYQYYIPAYLVALVDERTEEFYLNGVLSSLWYESCPPSADFFDPHKGPSETLRELETKMPYIAEAERKAITEHLPGITEMHAKMKEKAGYNWVQGVHDYFHWQERMLLFTDQQKKCVARLLVQIFARTKDPFDAPQIYTMLDQYWGAFLKPGTHTE